MTAMIRTWLEGRTPREQVMLAVLAGLAAGVLLWLGVARPVADWKADAAGRRAQAASELALIRRAAGPGAAGPGAAVGDPAAILRDSAEAAGLQATVSGDGFTVSAAPSRVLFGWLATLKTAHGLEAAELIVSKNADATLEAKGRLAPTGAGA